MVLMIWAGMFDYIIVGPIRGPEGVKLTFKTYCKLLVSVLLPQLENLLLPSRRKVTFSEGLLRASLLL